MKWGISKLKDNPPRQAEGHPTDDSYSFMRSYCQGLNEQHALAGTGEVFKIFRID